VIKGKANVKLRSIASLKEKVMKKGRKVAYMQRITLRQNRKEEKN
jgi:hypothetical protein